MRKDMYFVETEERSYNSVDSIYHFTYTVRRSWDDRSPIVRVWKWIEGEWQDVTKDWTP